MKICEVQGAVSMLDVEVLMYGNEVKEMGITEKN
jgi:hypothetical protein